MSDYSLQVTWSTKDALATGSALKGISATELGNEFSAIATAVATKYDSTDRGAASGLASLDASSLVPVGVSGDATSGGGQLPEATATALGAVELATTAETITGTDTSRAVTPADVQAVLDQNAGMLTDISGLSDPGADTFLGWDDSAGAIINFTLGTGLATTTTSLGLSHLGIEDLSDAGADSFMIWDDSAGATAFAALASESGLAISATPDLAIDISALSNSLTGATVAGADLLLIDDGAGGTNKKIALQDFGIPITNDATTTPMSSADLTYANRWYSCSNASAISFVIPANASVAYPIGTVFYVYQAGAGQVTVSVTSDTLHAPNGDATAAQYSVLTVTKVAATEWVVTGDVA